MTVILSYSFLNSTWQLSLEYLFGSTAIDSKVSISSSSLVVKLNNSTISDKLFFICVKFSIFFSISEIFINISFAFSLFQILGSVDLVFKIDNSSLSAGMSNSPP